jgi:hypothetical protein
MIKPATSPVARLRECYAEAIKTRRIGGAGVLQQLSDLASACVLGTSNAQDAVAFALFEVFQRHAEDREERPVTVDDTYHLLASGEELLSEAVRFIETGGNSDDATRIVAGLARTIPDRLYGRWPPDFLNR